MARTARIITVFVLAVGALALPNTAPASAEEGTAVEQTAEPEPAEPSDDGSADGGTTAPDEPSPATSEPVSPSPGASPEPSPSEPTSSPEPSGSPEPDPTTTPEPDPSPTPEPDPSPTPEPQPTDTSQPSLLAALEPTFVWDDAATGDGDGVLQPGESGALVVDLCNDGEDPLTDVALSVQMDHVTFESDAGDLGALAAGTCAVARFPATVAPDAPTSGVAIAADDPGCSISISWSAPDGFTDEEDAEESEPAGDGVDEPPIGEDEPGSEPVEGSEDEPAEEAEDSSEPAPEEGGPEEDPSDAPPGTIQVMVPASGTLRVVAAEGEADLGFSTVAVCAAFISGSAASSPEVVLAIAGGEVAGAATAGVLAIVFGLILRSLVGARLDRWAPSAGYLTVWLTIPPGSIGPSGPSPTRRAARSSLGSRRARPRSASWRARSPCRCRRSRGT